MMISNIEPKCFQINFMLELFMCLRLELLELLKKNYSLIVTFFFQICDANFLASFLLFTFSLEFSLFFSFFSLQEFLSLKNLGEGGLIQLFNPKISPN